MPARTTPTPKASKPRDLVLKPVQEEDPLEEWHQERIFTMAALYVSKHPLLAFLFHVPNGGYRRKSEAAALQRRGVKAGVPDIFLPIARGGWIGLLIELKRFRNGRLTPEQEAWMRAMAAAGWKVVMARGWRAAWREIMRYIHLPATHQLKHVGGSPTTRKDEDHT